MASPLTVTDKLVDSTGAAFGFGRNVFIHPLSLPLFVEGSAWNPADDGKVGFPIASDGTFTLTLPWPAVCDPSSVTFSVTLPDGTVGSGTVPSVAGPLTLHDLKVTYGWVFTAAPGTTVTSATVLTSVAVNGTGQSFEPGLDLVAGVNVTLTATDDPTTKRTHVTINSATDDDSAFLRSTNNLSDLASAATARTSLGLGTAATQASSAFDAAGLAAAEATARATAVSAEATTRANADALLAPIASPTFTGTVTVPAQVNATDPARKSYVDAETTRATAAEGTNSTAITTETTRATTAEGLRELTANKGAASGYAPLDGTSRVPDANLPADIPFTDVANTFTQPQTGPLLDKGGAVYNVAAYGAVGDGVTDDSAAFAATITAAAAGGGGFVQLGVATYVAEFHLPSGVKVRGRGPNATKVKAVPGSSNLGAVTISAITQCNWAGIEDIRFLGNGNAGQCGLYFPSTDGMMSGLWDSTFRNVFVSGFALHQMWLKGGGVSGLAPHQFLIFDNCEFLANTTGYAVFMSGQVGQVEVRGGNWDGPGRALGVTNLRINRECSDTMGNVIVSDESPYTITFRGTSFQQNTKGVLVDRGQAFFRDCHFEPLSYAIDTQNSAFVVVDGCQFNAINDGSGGGYCVRAQSSSRAYIRNCITIGTTDHTWVNSNGSIFAGPSLVSSGLTSGNTVQVSPAASLTLNWPTTLITGDGGTTPIQTINSSAAPGEVIYLRALSNSFALATGGNISLGPLSSPMTVPTNQTIALVRYDLGATWAVVAPGPTGPTGATGGLGPTGQTGAGYQNATVVATANNALSGLPTVDGVTLTDGQVILLVGQTAASENGLWVTHAGAWARPGGWPSAGEASGTVVLVESGTQFAGKMWTIQGVAPITIDTTAQSWQPAGGRLVIPFTSTGTFVVPPGVTAMSAWGIAAGGGGGGGGAATGTTLQGGAGGGGAGAASYAPFAVTPGHTLTVTIPTGGSGGNGGTAPGGGGSSGSGGGNCTIVDTTASTTLVLWVGGAGGAQSNGNSTGSGNGGVPGNNTGTTSTLLPGCGGIGNSQSGGPLNNVCGGGGGGPATATNGGSGGGVANGKTGSHASQGSSGGSGTATGGTGSSGAANTGSGGGGGGGGATGVGNGGPGGTGGTGYCELYVNL